jgi:hypothetical protein
MLIGKAAKPRFRKVAVPSNFPTQPPNACLPTGLNQEAQSLFDGRPLRHGPAAAHCLAHQAIIDLNVGSHFCLDV